MKVRAADLFCGAGGISTGITRAVRALGGSLTLTAVNHWEVAIETHKRNHPEHAPRTHCADLETARPRELVPEGYLDLLTAAPSCVFHSRARGGRPVHDQQRMDPWHVVRWCTELRVKRLIVENVPEFVEWGPCDRRTGRPIKSRKGEYFRAWRAALHAIGFRTDYRNLCAADAGDPTTRTRFILIGRSDRGPLQWPDMPHAKHGSADLLGERLRWNPAADIIDWSLPGKSIFNRKRPLKPNTLRRMLAGAERYGWPKAHCDAIRALLEGREPVLDVPAEDAAPFLVHFRGTSDDAIARSGRAVEDPVPALTAGGSHLGLVMATGAGGVARPLEQPVPTITAGGDGGARPHFVTPLLMGTSSGALAKPVEDPAPTITTGGNGRGNARPQLMVPIMEGAEPIIVSKHGGPGNAARGVSEPAYAVDTGGGGSVAMPLLSVYYGNTESATPVSQPLPSVTTKARFGLAEPLIVGTSNSSSAGVPRGAGEPLRTITTAKGGDMAVASPFLVPNFGEREGQTPRAHGIDAPLPSVTSHGAGGIVVPVLRTYRIDVLYRMLHWRELARAMSFDDEGEVYDFAGTATEITKQIGNAVPGRLAKLLAMAMLADMVRERAAA